MTDLAIIGCGHVGLVVGASFARLGHNVECIDIDAERVAALQRGECPIHEPGLPELIREGLEAGRLHFRAGYPDRMSARIVFLAVNTPSGRDGAADLGAVRGAVATLAPRLQPGSIIVNKSTVPIGTGDLVAEIAERNGAVDCSVVSNPEFLQEGSAIHNFLVPDRVVLGSNDPDAVERVAALYAALECPVQRTDIRTAEMVKYASNAFLATKISFINEIAAICEAVGADVTDVARGMGLDERIGAQFLRAGLGWGGSCFPKDTQSLAHMASLHGTHPQLLRSVMEINDNQRRRTLQKVAAELGGIEGRRVLVLGATFKPNTEDIRYSPALELADLLRTEGADVVVYDPVALHEEIARDFPRLRLVGSAFEGARGAHALVLATEWAEFAELPLEALAAVMERPLLVDARNFFDGAEARAAGFTYKCVGRPALEGGPAVSATLAREAALPAAGA